MKLALVLALIASPAFADDSLPPAKYDLGGETEAEVLLNYWQAFGELPPIERVPINETRAACDRLSMKVNYEPYPAALIEPGRRLIGCEIDGSIVYSFDPYNPEHATRMLRHELGHLLGWPGDHRRD